MSDDPSTKPSNRCSQCGGALLGSGPNAGCPRCSLAIAVDTEDVNEADIEVLFPELRIEGRIARGGFGTVYSAEHKMLKRRVALKFLDPSLAHSREVVERFGKEMEAVGRLDHPGIVRAHDAGERDGHWFIVMEFVDGEDLASISRRSGKMDASHACRIVRQAALALAYAHERGLVHRDVKPSNIMVAKAPDGGEMVAVSPVKVLDFGLAELGSEAPEGSERVFRGTPDYAAPELIETPDDVDVRADVFGLGATLFRLLTGRAPHALGGEESLTARMKRIALTPPPPVATLRTDLPPGLAAVCDKMLAMDRNARPATAAEVANLLSPYADPASNGSTIFRKRMLIAASALGLCFAGAAASRFFTDDSPAQDSQSPVVRMLFNDSGESMYFLNSTPIGQRGRAVEWSFYDADISTRSVTPLLFERTSRTTFVLRAIGTTRRTTSSGAQQYPFGLLAGDDRVTEETCLGFTDRIIEKGDTPGTVKVISGNSGVVDADFSGGTWLFTPASVLTSPPTPTVGLKFAVSAEIWHGGDSPLPLDGGRTYAARAIVR